MYNIISFLNIAFWVYEMMLLARILLSWFPHNPHNSVVRFLYETTDPYLNIFRRIIPPLGMIDISPIVAFLVLRMIQNLIFGLVR
ncbi:YggT family protein [Desulforamulus aeronauticus]|uniref:YggT family protein n=1 Tax=Desulforamulus aeronauticus TaxID=53343 RepID=UPI0009334453|nr:YggT family protein [Desulforamulus aeronauticus]